MRAAKTKKVALSDAEYLGLEVIHDYGIQLHSREIYVSGELESAGSDENGSEPGVEFLMSARFIKNMNVLAGQNKDPILVHMKTCGGEWTEGMAMYDAIAMSPCKVTVLSYTHARSMSSIILQAADRRVLMPNSYFLFHLGQAWLSGESETVVSNAKWLERQNQIMADLYARSVKRRKKGKLSKLSIADIKTKLISQMHSKGDVFLTPKEAVEQGFADMVFKGDWAALTKWT